MDEITLTIKRHIALGQIAFALEELSNFLMFNHPGLYDECIMQQAHFVDYKKRDEYGLLPESELYVMRTRLIQGILTILNAIDCPKKIGL